MFSRCLPSGIYAQGSVWEVYIPICVVIINVTFQHRRNSPIRSLNEPICLRSLSGSQNMSDPQHPHLLSEFIRSKGDTPISDEPTYDTVLRDHISSQYSNDFSGGNIGDGNRADPLSQIINKNEYVSISPLSVRHLLDGLRLRCRKVQRVEE